MLFEQNVKLFSAKIEPVTYIYYVPKTIDKLPFGEVELKPLQSHSAVNDKKFEVKISLLLIYVDEVFLHVDLKTISSN